MSLEQYGNPRYPSFMSHYRYHLLFCVQEKPPGKPCCAAGGNPELFAYAKQQLAQLNLPGVRVSHTGCLGRCRQGPSLVIYPEGVWYQLHSTADVDVVIAEHIQAGQVVEHLLMPAP
jgi:(2Fe-2S) ferredoxin